MDALTSTEFDARYSAKLKEFATNTYNDILRERTGVLGRSKVTTRMYLYAFALNSALNRSYLTEPEILRMLSYA
jgi:hypothetical protein